MCSKKKVPLTLCFGDIDHKTLYTMSYVHDEGACFLV